MIFLMPATHKPHVRGDDLSDILPGLVRHLTAREGAVRVIQTHISWVLLTPQHAYKLRKAVRLPFADFSTARRRHQDCLQELRLNQPAAPDLYLDVVRITGTPQEPEIGGRGSLLEHAVRMRRFPDDALLRDRIEQGRVTPEQLDVFARDLAARHGQAGQAGPRSPYGGPVAISRAAREALLGIRLRHGPLDMVRALEAWWASQVRALAPLWAQRKASGMVRELHGDLHLANLVWWEGRIVPFDALTFDPHLRWIDTLSDLAFLVMDLMAHDRGDLAWRLLNAYLDETGDHDGLPVLRAYLVYRALVRAHVALLSAPAPAQPDYLALAHRLAHGADPRLLITHGLPGSGKTHVSQRLLEQAGAIRLRSDVLRKRLFGLGPREASAPRVPAGIYGADATARTYARLKQLAGTSLRAGFPTIVDAACLRLSERESLARVAQAVPAPFAILRCRASDEVLRARIAARAASGRDASEADAAVLAQLQACLEPVRAAEASLILTVDADRPLQDDRLARDWLAQPPSPPRPISTGDDPAGLS